MDSNTVDGHGELPLFIAEYLVAKLSKRTLIGFPAGSKQEWEQAPKRGRTFDTHRPWLRTTVSMSGPSRYAVELSVSPETACMEVWITGEAPICRKMISTHYGGDLFKKMEWLYYRALNPCDDSLKDSQLYFSILDS